MSTAQASRATATSVDSPEHAEALWDQLFELGQIPHQTNRLLRPDIARIEAGFLQAHVDFVLAEEVVRPGRSRSPLNWGWNGRLQKATIHGRSALLQEKAKGSGIALPCSTWGNKPAHHSYLEESIRAPSPLPLGAPLNRIAYAQIEIPHGAVGDELVAEIYYQRELRGCWRSGIGRHFQPQT